MGAWIRSLLEDINYFNTILPRIPKKIQDGIKVKMYDAVIDDVDEATHEYWYGNTEKVTLGDILFEKPAPPKRSRRDRKYVVGLGISCPADVICRDTTSSSGALADDLLAQVREQERRKAEAVGKDYAARPASYKGSLSLRQDRFTTRKRSRSPTKREVEFVELEKPKEGNMSTSRSAPLSREAEERRRKLLETYGDAAAKSKPKSFD
ncbi:hypothetical protein DYB32_000130 [Aphanomyces invadans]|uniref:Pre-mRNA-splicing factor 38 n=1 Tax=Aphanomyces invadans TaxID=157072 RepID=A0A3R6ZXT4_9STRA|nr:hypothetical protein DYB32_000130 [Aphanomyces invadans]